MEHNRKNIFEKIGIFIPGYKGYAQREGRRDTDKLLRNKLSSLIDENKATLNNVMLNLTNSNNLSILNEIDRVKRNIEKISDKIKYRNYGESGFFDIVQIKERELEKLYQYDLALIDSINQIKKIIQNFENLPSNDQLKSKSAKVLEHIQELDRKLNKRKDIIVEVENAENN